MGDGRFIRRLMWLAICLILSWGLLSCDSQDVGPRVWIDEPIEGASFPAGEPVEITFHAYAREGLAEVLFSVNGQPVKRGEPNEPGQDFSKGTQQWLPTEAGNYVLQVRAFDVEGASSLPAKVNVRVAGKTVLRPGVTPSPIVVSPSPESLVKPTHTPTIEIRVRPTDTPTDAPPVVGPTVTWTLPAPPVTTVPPVIPAAEPSLTFTPVIPTPTSTPRPSDTPWPAAQINFRADRTSLEKGQCTTLRWDVEYATGVYLNGDGVTGHGSKEICPDNTATFTLRVEASQGGGDRQVTIQVSTLRDTDPPPVPSLSDPGNGSSVKCRKTLRLAWSPVKDASGIAGYSVKLEQELGTGSWSQVWNLGPGNNTETQAPVQCGGQYRWAVRARDNAGNESGWSGWSTFRID